MNIYYIYRNKGGIHVKLAADVVKAIGIRFIEKNPKWLSEKDNLPNFVKVYDTLTQVEQDVLQSLYLNGKRPKEAGEELGITWGNIKSIQSGIARKVVQAGRSEDDFPIEKDNITPDTKFTRLDFKLRVFCVLVDGFRHTLLSEKIGVPIPNIKPNEYYLPDIRVRHILKLEFIDITRMNGMGPHTIRLFLDRMTELGFDYWANPIREELETYLNVKRHNKDRLTGVKEENKKKYEEKRERARIRYGF